MIRYPNLVGDRVEMQPIKGKTASIRQTIQWFKDHGGVERFPRIMCMAGILAGRGISFTSKDHKWHLSEEYFIPSDSCDDPELIQKIRLSGNYDDSIPLTLYTPESVYSDLLKADATLEEIVNRLHGKMVESNQDSQSILPSLSMYKGKFTKRNHRKVGKLAFELTDYVSREERPFYFIERHFSNEEEKEEIQILLPKFRDWATQDTKIANFMKELDPRKQYTKLEMKELLSGKGINSVTHLLEHRSLHSNRYGKILQEYQGGYRLYPYLVSLFEEFF
jgi:hypothetical protein